MLINIITISLLAAFITFIGGFLIGKKGAIVINIGSSFILALCAIFMFYQIIFLQNIFYWDFGIWFKTDFLTVRWNFIFDDLTITLCCVVSIISLFVQIYSCSYMSHDPCLIKFLGTLSLFTFTMLLLITSDNLIQLFLGWEGVGLCSYLLINFWFTRIQANKSGLKALFINRIGDSALLLAIAFLIYLTSSVDFSIIFSLIPLLDQTTIFLFNTSIRAIDIISFLLLIAAFAKSAQLFLHTWLPDAMEGPTPVSALLHAATMVTAGVFLIIKCSPIIEYSPSNLTLIAIFGALTSLFSALIAVFQNDIKKIIAYSTCSQLGYMITSCGFSNYNGALFHLTTHAFFKALLFLTAGSIIHGYFNEQDIRKMGALLNIFKLSYVLFAVSSLSLMGVPFLSGFYSKDFIMETSLITSTSVGFFCYISQIAASFFTAFYSFRLIYLVFFTKNRGYVVSLHKKTHDMDLTMFFPLLILGFCSIFVGYYAKDLFIGLGSEFLKNSILILPNHSYHFTVEFLNYKLKLIPFFNILISLSFFLVYINYKSSYFNFVYNFFNRKGYFDYIYNYYFANSFLTYNFIHLYNTDKGILETIGPYGLSNVLEKTSWFQFKNQSGLIFHYSAHILFSLVFLITVVELFFY